MIIIYCHAHLFDLYIFTTGNRFTDDDAKYFADALSVSY